MAVFNPLWASANVLIVLYVTFNILAIAAVGLRFWSIRIRHRETKSHDWLCVLSLVCCLGYSIDTLVGTIDGGFGLHMTELPPSAVVIALRTFFASTLMWATSITAFRGAILVLYIQIFPVPYVRWSAYTCGTIVLGFYFGMIISIFVNCKPIAYNWNKTIPDGHCLDVGTSELAVAAFNIALDILIVLVPVPGIWRLHMPRDKKIGVTVTFALGLLIAGINLARIMRVLDCNLEDFTYCTLASAILTVAEMAFGIVIACVPTFGSIFFYRNGRSTHDKRSGEKHKSDNEESIVRFFKSDDSSSLTKVNDIELQRVLNPGGYEALSSAKADTTPLAMTHISDIHITKDFQLTEGREGMRAEDGLNMDSPCDTR